MTKDKCFDYLYSSKNLVKVVGMRLDKLDDGHYPFSKSSDVGSVYVDI
jgi:hypothetical protein